MNQRLLILVVDDLDKKRQTIIRALGRRLKNYDVVFESADRYEAALEKLRVRNYDFVILDVKIPAGNEPASEKWSRYLLDQITEGSLCFPMHVFGLTAHKEIADIEREYYELNLFGFFVFDWESETWAIGIVSKIEYLANAIRNGASYRLNSYDYDLLILTARYKSEFEPVQRVLFGSAPNVGHPLWQDDSFFRRNCWGVPSATGRVALHYGDRFSPCGGGDDSGDPHFTPKVGGDARYVRWI